MCESKSIYMCVCARACMYARMHVCMHVCMQVYLHTDPSQYWIASERMVDISWRQGTALSRQQLQGTGQQRFEDFALPKAHVDRLN